MNCIKCGGQGWRQLSILHPRIQCNRCGGSGMSTQEERESRKSEKRVNEYLGIENRHGSPTFYSLLEEMADTHDKKSHDYASNDNPFGNYHFAGQVSSMFAHSPNDAGFAGRLAEKIYRIANLERGEKDPKNESISDTERDIAVITLLWIADRRDRRNTYKITAVDYVKKEVTLQKEIEQDHPK